MSNLKTLIFHEIYHKMFKAVGRMLALSSRIAGVCTELNWMAIGKIDGHVMELFR